MKVAFINRQNRKSSARVKTHFETNRIRQGVRMLPKFLGLLVNLMRDSRVSSTDKAILGATMAYVLNPVDLVPDWIPFAGMVDDIYLVALALLRLFVRTDEHILKDHWKDEGDLVVRLKKISESAVLFLPPKLRQALLEKVRK
ncbi:MAG TPA: DUF1232 domain-containing protein [Thermodesulfobacteriaceae bacterium]|nr:DUF1232 domain-containing protein [Thermodesulfobacteriaceae bacterium]